MKVKKVVVGTLGVIGIGAIIVSGLVVDVVRDVYELQLGQRAKYYMVKNESHVYGEGLKSELPVGAYISENLGFKAKLVKK